MRERTVRESGDLPWRAGYTIRYISNQYGSIGANLGVSWKDPGKRQSYHMKPGIPRAKRSITRTKTWFLGERTHRERFTRYAGGLGDMPIDTIHSGILIPV